MSTAAGLSIASFSPVRLEDRELIERFFAENNPQSCEYNFPNLYSWGEAYHTRWRLFHGRLIIYTGLDDELLFPLGKPFPDARELCEISDAFRSQGKSGSINQPPSDFLKNYPEIMEDFNLEVNEDAGEYIYLAEKLATLSGSRLAKKKNLVSQFLRENPDCTCATLTKELAEPCIALSEKWRGSRTEAVEYLDQEKSAMERALRNFDMLGVGGLAAFRKGNLLAFAAFSRINSDSCTVHFEKYDPEIKGAAQYINWELAKILREKFIYVNREQDLGLPGLRQAKRSYAPIRIQPHISLRRKD
ncbi:MAG: hypothetical protein A2X49_04620 [Lentisphaerae bacterium GWF2_52_8]|nr:MAG: hypothetical protein A2X49_04620 [Lentisphaerae bacterium GWF2_52_8]